MHNYVYLYVPVLQAVSAEGESLVDLLDNYLKACVKDKKIEPFGGVLYDQYNYAWNPPGIIWRFCINFIKISVMASTLTEFDMNILQERLKEQKRMREKAALNKTPPSRRKEQYTPVEVDVGADEVKLVESATTDSESSGEGAFRHHPQCVKPPPPTSRKPRHSPSSSTIENETTPKRKPIPPTPAKKPSEAPNPKPIVTREDTSRVPPTQGQSLIDRMNQPLPPTPVDSEESPIPSSAGRNKTSATSTTGSALLKEIKAKQGKNSSTGDGEKRSKKKQPIPTPTQRSPSQKNEKLAALTIEQLHEPAGYANLPVHDAPYQNMGFGPDAGVPPEEPDVLYENTSHVRKSKSNRSVPSGTQPHKGYLNTKTNGKELSDTGSEYQNINARRPRIRESPQKH